MATKKKQNRAARGKTRERKPRSFTPDHRYSVVFSAERVEALLPIARTVGVDCGCRHPSLRHDAGGIHLGALVSGRALKALAADTRWRTHVIGDQTIAGRKALKLVGKGNRFRKRGALPEGTGRLA
jgi:hypothetical protein